MLQYGDLADPPAYEVLDRRVRGLFPTETARRIADELARRSDWMFFSKWQLLLTIKLICAFGSRDAGIAGTSESQLLMLLMVNSFYPGGEDAPDTPEGDLEAVQETTLYGYALIQYERPYNLIGRYAELLDHLPAPGNRAGFRTSGEYWPRIWAFQWTFSRPCCSGCTPGLGLAPHGPTMRDPALDLEV